MKKRKADNSSIGNNIKTLRKAKGFTQLNLSEKTGISTTAISAYENGKKTVGLFTLATFAKTLGCSMDDLYYGVGPKRLTASSSEGELLVNCIVALWEKELYDFLPYETRNNQGDYSISYRLSVIDVESIIEELINKLNDLKRDEQFYTDSEKVKQQYMTSAISKINSRLEKYKK